MFHHIVCSVFNTMKSPLLSSLMFVLWISKSEAETIETQIQINQATEGILPLLPSQDHILLSEKHPRKISIEVFDHEVT